MADSVLKRTLDREAWRHTLQILNAAYAESAGVSDAYGDTDSGVAITILYPEIRRLEALASAPGPTVVLTWTAAVIGSLIYALEVTAADAGEGRDLALEAEIRKLIDWLRVTPFDDSRQAGAARAAGRRY